MRTLLVAGILYSAVVIMLVGLCLLALCKRIGLSASSGATGHVLCSFALGVYSSTVFALIWISLGLQWSNIVVVVKLAVDAVVVASAFLVARRELVTLSREILADRVLVATAALGLCIGMWAFWRYPHVLDSGQLIWTQSLLTVGRPEMSSSMVGFSALVLFLGRVFGELPVVTVAAAFKPLLGLVAGVTVCHAVTCLKLRWRLPSTLVAFALMLLSGFGLYGLTNLGKDSIYGVLLSIAFMASLCRPAAERRSVELGILFATAATLGVIAVPYALAAYLIWLVLAPQDARAWSTLPAMWLVGLPVLPSVLSGFLGRSFVVVMATYLLLGLAIAILRRAAAAFSFARIAPLVEYARPWIPALFALPCLVMLPFELAFPVWRNVDGSLVTEVRAPLDGKTTLVGLLTNDPQQATTVIAGSAAAMLLGFTSLGRGTPGLIAMAAMPFAVLFAALVRLWLRLPVISDFNVWDIIKDVPLWYGGPLFGLLALAGVQAGAETVLRARFRVAGAIALGAWLIYSGIHRLDYRYFIQPVTFTSIGGYSDADMARTSELAWQRFRERIMYFDNRLSLTQSHFYSFQMYEVRPSFLAPADIERVVAQVTGPTGFVIRRDLLDRLVAVSSSTDRSVRQLATVQNGEGVVIEVELKDPSGRKTADIVSLTGFHDAERVGPFQFHWVRNRATVLLALRRQPECVEIRLFSHGRATGSQIVRIGGGAQPLDVELSGATAANPARAVVEIEAGKAETALNLTTSIPSASFPNDDRQISYGLLTPIYTAGEAPCR